APGQPRGGEGARRRDVGELFESDVRDAPLAYPGAAEGPLIARVENRGQIVVAEHRRWEALAPAGDRRVDHATRLVNLTGPVCLGLDGVVRIAVRRYNPQRAGLKFVLALAAASLAWPHPRAERAAHRQCLHRDHPLRSDEVRGGQGFRLSAGRSAAAHFLATALAVRFHPADLLRGAGAAARARLRAR